jgi:hypothetical protein
MAMRRCSGGGPTGARDTRAELGSPTVRLPGMTATDASAVAGSASGAAFDVAYSPDTTGAKPQFEVLQQSA